MTIKKILVTGGAGFIGSNFILEWLESDPMNEIINLDALTYAGNLDNLSSVAEDPRYTFFKSDLKSELAQIDLNFLLNTHHPDAIVHFAAESHVDRSITGPLDFVMTNVVGTFNLLEAFRKYYNRLTPTRQKEVRFIHVSTDEVYGSLNPDEPAFTEEHKFEPNSPYSASKASSDHFVRAYHHTYGLPVVTTNCSNNYGPFQYPEKLIPLVINNAINGKSLPIYGDGKQVRDWLYVRDHCRAIMRVLQVGRLGETYNVGGCNEKTNIEIVTEICKLLDELVGAKNIAASSYTDLITYVTDRPGHDRRYAIDNSKIQTELGWEPQETFESGLRKTVQWYLENLAWTAKIIFNQQMGESIQVPVGLTREQKRDFIISNGARS